MLHSIKPIWSAPAHIHAFSTTRLGGESCGAYQGLNLGLHVEDDSRVVLNNRALLSDAYSLPESIDWLNQTHSTILFKLSNVTTETFEADASWTLLKDRPCVVMTADCLPVLVTDQEGSFVCAIHAGWRGLCDGIIEQSIYSICRELDIETKTLLVWLGPCIGKTAFIVGNEVRNEFIVHHEQAKEFFSPHQNRWLADLHQLARLRLTSLNVAEITVSEHCTFNEPELFYSYRRDGKTGRMATVIWIS